MTQQEMGFSPKNTQHLLSLNALSFALLTMAKTNELARKMCNALGFRIINDFLEQACLENAQVGYNIVCTLWILSYHEFSHEYFADTSMAIIERVSKILDYCSWEKIVRIMLMLFDNLKEQNEVQESLSDIDALSLIIKLQNRHWVDEDINKLLEKLYEYFDENQ